MTVLAHASMRNYHSKFINSRKKMDKEEEEEETLFVNGMHNNIA